MERDDDEFNKNIGYRHEQNGQTYFEYHVDDHEDFAEHCNAATEFGGYLSVRKPPVRSP